ncbi:MAG: hypothetical protein JWP20_1806 [Roseomonas sp.]|jgi:hypothetical protein|nr:hypothetical protein [Roseomonas sp.]
MPETQPPRYTAFAGHRLIAAGDLPDVVSRARAVLDQGGKAPVSIFDDHTRQLVQLDLSGVPGEVPECLEPPPRRAGRPRLGVVAREVTLLPRHWEWLAQQPGGASVALRRLVEAARQGPESDAGRQRMG